MPNRIPSYFIEKRLDDFTNRLKKSTNKRSSETENSSKSYETRSVRFLLITSDAGQCSESVPCFHLFFDTYHCKRDLGIF
jgi:hypothetical protein